MVINMPENNLDKLNLAELWAFIVVILAGAIGGCAAAFSSKTNSRKLVTLMTVSGYTIVGIFGALVTFTIMSSVAINFYADLKELVLWSALSGFSTAIGLVGTNLGFRVILKRLGIELEIRVKRKDPKD